MMNISIGDTLYDMVYGDCVVNDIMEYGFEVEICKTKHLIEYNNCGVPNYSLTDFKTIFYSKSESIVFMASIPLIDIGCMFCELNEILSRKEYQVITKSHYSLDNLLDEEFKYPSDAAKFMLNNQNIINNNYKVWSMDSEDKLIGFLSVEDYKKVLYKLLDKALYEYINLVKEGTLKDAFHIVKGCENLIDR